MDPPADSEADPVPHVGQRGQRIEPRAQRRAHRRGIDAELAQHGRHHPALLLEQDGQQVLRGGLRVAALVGKPLGGLQRLL